MANGFNICFCQDIEKKPERLIFDAMNNPQKDGFGTNLLYMKC